VEGCKCTLKFSFVDSLRKSPENLGKIPEIWTECLEIRIKKAPNVFGWKKWRQTFAKKHMKTCFWRSHQKDLRDLCGRVFVGKIAQNLIGKVWGNSVKILHTPKHSPPPTRVAEPEPRSRPFSVETELLTKFSWSRSWWLI